ncbi:hypothetical protein [Paracoccus sp. 22332]|uniref:hypothetical protein n=1 Tax=Paracoccus sp. 22332 TaxID=3453913 RepID=UPI003F839109
MTIHHAFIHPAARPALAPSLFPAGMDKLLSDRKETLRLATYCVAQTEHPYRMAARIVSWAARMDARIAQVAS